MNPPVAMRARSCLHRRIIGSTSGAPQIAADGRVAQVSTICYLNGASLFEFLRRIAFVGFG
jgi:hypothetical protein